MTSQGRPKYRPMPAQKRFWGFFSEQYYTDEELNFRELVLKLRSQSGLHRDLLQSTSTWFGEAKDALFNPNENSWIGTATFKPRHHPNRDEFYVQPIEGLKLQWKLIEQLMQQLGDYLILRNQDLPDEHLNQPMNFVLMDLNNMLRQLAQNPDAHQVKDQLDLLVRYVRAIEKNTSPLVGSDKLFLANLRHTVDTKVQPGLSLKIESKKLQLRLDECSKTLKQLSTDRNRILHFALNGNEVNAHVRDFSDELTDEIKKFPTLAAKKCGQTDPVGTKDTSSQVLNIKDIKQCKNVQLITQDSKVLEHYARAISDLNDIERYQTLLSQVIELLGQAGEVYTVSQFKDQLVKLLVQLDNFLDESSLPLDAIIQENIQLYHKAIQDSQSKSYLQQLTRSEDPIIKNYLKNQDALAQFPSSTSDLKKTRDQVKRHVHEVIQHLSETRLQAPPKDLLAGKAQELNQIINQMDRMMIHSPESIPKVVTRKLLFFSEPPRPETRLPRLAYRTPNPNAPWLFLFMAYALPVLVGVVLYHSIMSQNRDEPKPKSNDQQEFETLKEQVDDLLTEIQQLDDTEIFELLPEYETYMDAIEDYEAVLRSMKRGIYNLTQLKEIYKDLCFVHTALNPSVKMG